MATLSKNLTVREFDNGYWYAAELKKFASSVGIPLAGSLRKDELETAIKRFLQSGKTPPAARAKGPAPGISDTDSKLTLDRTVRNYKNNEATWNFIEREAKRLDPEYRRKSGARYRLNRWREEQIARDAGITYGDLVRKYVTLSRTEGPFAKAQTGRYINFLSDFFASEKGATREEALRAWHELKALDAPKTYRSWVRFRRGSRP